MNDFKQNALALGLSTLLVVGLSMLTYQLGYQRGEVRAKGEAQAREAQINADHAEALLHATAREQATERTLRTELTDLQTRLNLDAQNAKQISDRSAAAVRSGAVRLSIPVASCPSDGGSNPGPGAGSAGGDRHQARAQLAPEYGLALTAIADAGDDSIRQLNACIDAYNAVKVRLNAKPTGEAHAQAR